MPRHVAKVGRTFSLSWRDGSRQSACWTLRIRQYAERKATANGDCHCLRAFRLFLCRKSRNDKTVGAAGALIY